MKSIIETIETDVRMQYENGVLKAVKNVGFNIDKERLTQALVDSRSFYDEGYRDAKLEYKREWISVKNRLPEEYEEVLVCFDTQQIRVWSIVNVNGKVCWEDEFGYWQDLDDVTAWMPLPETYKAGGLDD